MKDYSNYIPEKEPNRKKAWEEWNKKHPHVMHENVNMVYSGRSTQKSPRHMKHQGASVAGIRIK